MGDRKPSFQTFPNSEIVCYCVRPECPFADSSCMIEHKSTSLDGAHTDDMDQP